VPRRLSSHLREAQLRFPDTLFRDETLEIGVAGDAVVDGLKRLQRRRRQQHALSLAEVGLCRAPERREPHPRGSKLMLGMLFIEASSRKLT
jgi:hypothetical protein